MEEWVRGTFSMYGDDIKLKEVFSPIYKGRIPVVRARLDLKTVLK
jgi:hypothetical protein